ncbi:ENTH domain protein [Cryptosporidium meleagridis]|uniref:ENTH domain protein n=1 Tax=Cryptosporidium meleagridis TaxID=93969 RepID=A0A2P4Z4G8_9CRYT|nr:ENTH domain protein [Cryptosporidium meleagridis]
MELNDVGRLLMSMTRKMKKTASQIVHPLTQLEKWLKEATSNTNWGCSSTILNEIARSMTDYHDYVLVQKCIGDCLSEKAIKWRRIFKTLVLVEYLLKNGIDRFVDDFKEYMYKVRHLQDFYYTEEGKDKGAGIREKSKYILNLMNDPVLLKSERKKARDNRGKYIGINGRGGLDVRSNNYSISNAKFSNKSTPTSSSSSASISSYSVSTNINSTTIGELYDPYCYNGNNHKDDDHYSSSRAGSNVSDGLDVVKNAGIAEESIKGFSETNSNMINAVKLPVPPTYKGLGARKSPMVGVGGIRRVESTKEVPGLMSGSGNGNRMVWISDESISNAAQKLAGDHITMEGPDKEEDLQWSDWNSFVAAETTITNKGASRGEVEIEENSLDLRSEIIRNNDKSKDSNTSSLNPFELNSFGVGVDSGAKTQTEIERRKKIMDESIFASNLLDLDYNSRNNLAKEEEGVGDFDFGFRGGFQQQENGGPSVGNSNNKVLHIPHGF